MGRITYIIPAIIVKMTAVQMQMVGAPVIVNLTKVKESAKRKVSTCDINVSCLIGLYFNKTDELAL